MVDLAGGHGLLAQIMLILDDSSPEAFLVDNHPPPSALRLAESMLATWPRLYDRLHFEQTAIEAFALTRMTSWFRPTPAAP